MQGYDGPQKKIAENTEMKIKSKFDFRGMITDRCRQEKTVALFQDWKYTKMYRTFFL